MSADADNAVVVFGSPAGAADARASYSHGRENANPPGMSLAALWREDLHTHEGKWLSPGFQTLFVHRFGNWRMSIRTKLIRAPLTLMYRLMARWVKIHFGIEVDYGVRLGRRVRFWHHGGIVLSALAIGDDVQIRHNTTLGVARRGAGILDRPIVGDRVDIGTGACILGPVVVGDDSMVGANCVVVRDVPARSVVAGVPGRVIRELSDAGAVARPHGAAP